MQFTQFEESIIRLSMPALKDCRVIRLVLDAQYDAHYPHAEKENISELNSYSKEAMLFAIIAPLARLFFCNKIYSDSFSVKTQEQFVEYCKAYLEQLNFGGGYLSSLKQGK